MGLTLDTGRILRKGYNHSYITPGKFSKDILIRIQIRLRILQCLHEIGNSSGILW